MKLVGQIYGADLMLDTEDEVLLKQVAAYFEQLRSDSIELNVRKDNEKLLTFKRKSFCEKLGNLINRDSSQ